MKVLVFRYEKHILFNFLDTKWRRGSTMKKSRFFIHLPGRTATGHNFCSRTKNQKFS